MKQPWWQRLFRPLFSEKQDSARLRLAGPERPGQLDTETLRGFLEDIFSTHPEELDCTKCFEEVGRFAEYSLVGKDAAEAMPLVQEHLNRCCACREEFEALLAAIEEIA